MNVFVKETIQQKLQLIYVKNIIYKIKRLF